MHVLVVHIGPVQEFIESARKCRDLWFGSWLLSELARAAAKAVVRAEGRDEREVLVFPGAPTTDADKSVANKVVARIARPPGDVAQAAETAMRVRLAEVRQQAFARVAPRNPQRDSLFHEQTAIDQVDAAIEFLWAAAPEGAEGYKPALSEAERLLAAVKNSKVWDQPAWAKAGVPKSSLDGIRESVLDEKIFDPTKRGGGSTEGHTSRIRRDFGVHGSERLCGIGLLKRFGNRRATPGNAESPPDRIFSTSHVASAPFRAGLARLPHGPGAWERLRSALSKVNGGLVASLDDVPAGREDPITGRIDGSVFYEGRLVEALEELGDDGTPDAATERRAREALASFLGSVRSDIGDPIPYYALLFADGDRMGKVIGEATEFKQHRELSETLEAFATSTRATVAEHDGALVYAGGDDVLALVPLHTVLACARKLAAQFATQMGAWTVGEDGANVSPTLSVGVVVVHHLVPLDEALALVRSTEKAAKAVPGKNALAIVVKKRGGEAIQISGTWGELDVRLTELIGLHRIGGISRKAQYELLDLATRTKKAGALAEIIRSVREMEARRIIARKRASGGVEAAKEHRDALDRLGAYEHPARLGRELYVAQLLAQAAQQAEPCKTDAPAATTAEASR